MSVRTAPYGWAAGRDCAEPGPAGDPGRIGDSPGRVVVVEFETMAAAKAFYDSALYRQAREARAGATELFDMICVEGVPMEGKQD